MQTLDEKLISLRPYGLAGEAFRRVVLGAKNLENYKPGSVAQLNTDVLDIGDGEKCPAGQVFGTFWNAPKLMQNHAVECGLAVGDDKFVTNPMLTAAWRVVVITYREHTK